LLGHIGLEIVNSFLLTSFRVTALIGFYVKKTCAYPCSIITHARLMKARNYFQFKCG